MRDLLPRRGPRAVAVAALLALAACLAWQLRFLCDDAYITFRYVANAHDGAGLVWNPAPFLPVEGYTGFSWAVVLWAVWEWFGVAPPDSANVLSIGFGLGQLALVLAAAGRLRRRDGSPVPFVVVGTLGLALVGNRTFVQWFTSGLETALFHWAFLGWILHAFRQPCRSGRGIAVWSTWAALTALTRPDGLLPVAATVAIAAIARARRQVSTTAVIAGALPLLTVLAHLAWRRSFYGEWLPNTYYAKVTGAWPEAGVRYLACFALEHGAWLWGPTLAAAATIVVVRHVRTLPAALLQHAAPLAAIGVVLCQCGYYTLVVGGDHFEYRVYAHLVPLALLAVTALAARVAQGNVLPIAAALGMWLAATPGWVHLHHTRDMPEHGFRPVAPQVAEFLQPLARWFDRQQAWLRLHMVGLRCNHHALFLARAERRFPPRGTVTGGNDPWPVLTAGAVGVPGWVLPNVVILDLHGLNDWVVARNPVTGIGAPMSRDTLRPVAAAADADRDGWLRPEELRAALRLLAPTNPDPEAPEYLGSVLMAMYARQRPDALSLEEAARIGESLAGARSMAHEKAPPSGYVDGLPSNVEIEARTARAHPRTTPLTADAIRAFEAAWRTKVLRGELGRPR